MARFGYSRRSAPGVWMAALSHDVAFGDRQNRPFPVTQHPIFRSQVPTVRYSGTVDQKTPFTDGRVKGGRCQNLPFT